MGNSTFEETLTTLKNEFNDLVNDWQNNIALLKTPQTKGITLEDWNTLVTLLQRTETYVRALKPFIDGFGDGVADSIENLETKVDTKLTKAGKPVDPRAQLYGVTKDGVQVMYKHTTAPDAFSVISRDTDGNARVGTPETPKEDHIVNVKMLKEQVEDIIGEIKESIDAIPDANGQHRGMMTRAQAVRLQNLYELLEKNTDDQINKIKEVLSAFEGADEEFKLLTALNKKLDKNSESGSARVYGVDKDGNQAMYRHTSAADAYALVSRDNKGRAKVGTPELDSHIANKKYVDDNVGVKVVDLTSDLYTSTFKNCKFYIVTAFCGTHGPYSNVYCKSWTVSNKLIQNAPVETWIEFETYTFTSIDSNGEDITHVLRLNVMVEDASQMSFNVNCDCSGLTADDFFTVFVEGVN